MRVKDARQIIQSEVTLNNKLLEIAVKRFGLLRKLRRKRLQGTRERKVASRD